MENAPNLRQSDQKNVPGAPADRDSAGDHSDSAASVLQSIRRIIGRVPRVVLRKPIEQHSFDVVSDSASSFGQARTARYQVHGEINRGGMGAILFGHDVDLGRDLAIKVLLDEHRDRPEVIRRFIEEAQIGGQLQHPGIAPVYELGQFSDERPFFSMKLVDGQTLSSLLSQRAEVADDHARFIGIFEQVCQTIAYAHSRGVIHRDLKPGNVMVGAFGEVQVMDWGLAKVLDAKKTPPDAVKSRRGISQTFALLRGNRDGQKGVPAGDSVDADGDSTDASRTAMGSVMGTPAYMPPEQARGQIDRLDERTDVFGLGAILCQILTGQPPYVGEDRHEVATLAATAQLEPCRKRLDASGAAADLIALAKDCLDPNPRSRPSNAEEVSKRVLAHLESVEIRLRQAAAQRAADAARIEEERKRRKVLYALVATILGMIGLAAAGWIWGQAKEHQLAKANLSAEFAAASFRQRTEQRINEELSGARGLIDREDRFDVATMPTLLRAIDAVEKAKSQAFASQLDASLLARIEDLELSLQTHRKDLQLFVAIENAWERELAHMDAFRSRRPSKFSHTWVGGMLDLSPGADALPYYRSAFQNWGVSPGVTPIDEAARRVMALPEPARTRVIVSLDRWYRLLDRVRTVDQWQQVEWSTLTPIELKTGGSDVLEVQPDGSIFASGNEQRFGYTMVFETDQTVLPALRLEALPDPRLPKGGPGRGADGGFWFWALQFHYAPRDHRDLQRRLHTHASSTDASDPERPIFMDYWKLPTELVAKKATAIFDAKSLVHSPSGFQITITIRDKVPSPSAESNLGRFRWSVPVTSIEFQSAAWLDKLIARVDTDPWRRQMKAEIHGNRPSALAVRAREQQDAPTQPKSVLIQMAEMLRVQAQRQLVPPKARQLQWTDFRPETFKSALNAEMKIRDDGSLEFFGGENGNDVIEITTKLNEPRVSAILLLMISGKASDGSGVGDISRVDKTGLCFHEVTAEMSASPEFDDPISIDFDRILVSAAEQTKRNDPPSYIEWAIDGDRESFFELVNPTYKRDMIFTTSHPPQQGEMYLRIRFATGGNKNANLGKFKVKVLSDEFTPLHPLQTARDLMQRLQVQDPTDYWINRALTGLYSGGSFADTQSAHRYATAAVSLRPDSSAAHAMLIRQLPLSGAFGDDRLIALAKLHQQRLNELQAGEDERWDVLTPILKRAGELVHRSRRDEAKGQIRLAIALSDDAMDLESCAALVQSEFDEPSLLREIETKRKSIAEEPNP